VIIAILARFWLDESISLERWAGIVLITLGVGFVAQGPSLTQHPAPDAVESAEREHPEPEPVEPQPLKTKVEMR
jgi:drug/metabolite transporter (DMT)-like permease